MCLTLPLKNDTTTVIMRRNDTTIDTSKNSNTVSKGKNPISATSFSSLLLERFNRFNASVGRVEFSTIQKVVKSKRSSLYMPSNWNWIKYIGNQSIFIPVKFPQGDRDHIIRLMKEVSAVMRRKSVMSPILVRNGQILPSILSGFIIMLIIVTLTITLRRARSLEFVRSPTIVYFRAVDKETRAQLTKVKASLPNLVGMKGVYGRGRLKEISDVFNCLGSNYPLQIEKICFAGDFNAKKSDEPPFQSIKLLTPEEVARDDL